MKKMVAVFSILLFTLVGVATITVMQSHTEPDEWVRSVSDFKSMVNDYYNDPVFIEYPEMLISIGDRQEVMLYRKSDGWVFMLGRDLKMTDKVLLSLEVNGLNYPLQYFTNGYLDSQKLLKGGTVIE